MPGAGSPKLANWLYEAAPQDGTVFATMPPAARGLPTKPDAGTGIRRPDPT